MGYSLNMLEQGENGNPFSKCVLYVPDKIDENTSVFIFEHGSGHGLSEVQAYAETTQPNQIIIAPYRSGSSTNDSKHYNELMDMVESVRKEYNITNNNLTSSGFSAGGYYGLAAASANIEAHQGNIDPQIVWMVDDFSDSMYNPESTYNKLNLDNLKDNNSIMFMLEQPCKYLGGDTGKAANKAADYYAEQGLNVIRVECKASNGSNAHSTVKQRFFDSGFAEFSQGTSTLPNSEYFVYRAYNRDTHEWEEIDVNDINTINKVYNYFGIDGNAKIGKIYEGNLKYLQEVLGRNAINLDNIDISSDLGIVLSNVNNIYSQIKNTTIINNKVSLAVESSTTKIPSRIGELVSSYCGSVSTALCDLVKTLKLVEDSGYTLDEGEKEIAREAETVNDNVAVNLGVDAVTASAVVGADLADKELEVRKPESVVKEKAKDTSDEVISKDGGMTNDTIELPKDKPDSKDVPKTTIPVKKVKYEPISSELEQDTNNTVSSWKAEFPEYNELYSSDDKVVFDCNNEFKIILHRDGDTITGIEYYYDFGSSENAAKALFNLKSMYQDSGIENIMMKDRYVKVIFNDSMFNNLSVSEFRNRYSNLNEIVKL